MESKPDTKSPTKKITTFKINATGATFCDCELFLKFDIKASQNEVDGITARFRDWWNNVITLTKSLP